MRIKIFILFVLFSIFECQIIESSKAEEIVQESLIIAGDAGNTNSEAIKTLAQQAQRFPSQTSLYLLGDNIYPAGLPNKGHTDYEQALDRLNRQISTLKGTASKIVFIPGNHDWDNSGGKGYQYIKNEDNAVSSALGKGSFAPSQGCPGPVVVEERSWVKVIVIDSQWWLHTYEKPSKPSDGCETWNEEGVLAKIRQELTTGSASNKPVIFLQHHPLESVGTHARGASCNGDFGCQNYQSMRSKLLTVLNVNKPLICAGGHDHSLQYLVGDFGCKNFIVSGSMSYPTAVFPDARTRYASGVFGFMRIDFLGSKKIRLQIIEIAKGELLGKVAYEVFL